MPTKYMRYNFGGRRTITSGSKFAWRIALAFPIPGLRTTGGVRCDQPRVLDIRPRGGRKFETLPSEILDEVLAKAATLCSQSAIWEQTVNLVRNLVLRCCMSPGEAKTYRQTFLLALILAAAFSAPEGFAQTSPAPIRSMAAEADPSFAVATIKPHDPASYHQGIEVAGERIRMFSQSVSNLMVFAYSINRSQIVDGPAWLAETRYDIEGTSDIAGEPNRREQEQMIQKLLADRFQLRFHREKRELNVYALRIVKGGPKLSPAANANGVSDEHANGHGFWTTRSYTDTSIADFIQFEQFFLDRPLMDQTALTGRYDFIAQLHL